jgi:ubiquinone/menaquinone biosynthesis C-methylase UbiE
MAPSLIEAARKRGSDVTDSPAPASQAPAAPARGKPATPINAPQYHLGDARDLNFLPQDCYDSAACVLAIQNIHPLPPVFASACRVLKPGGKLVLAMMHPCFRVFQASHWGWDESGKVQFRRIDNYLLPRKVPILTHPGQRDGAYTWSFHRPLETYVTALRNAGLLIDAIEEWPSHKTSQPGARAAAENTARKEIPMFMAIRAVRIASLESGAEA